MIYSLKYEYIGYIMPAVEESVLAMLDKGVRLTYKKSILYFKLCK